MLYELIYQTLIIIYFLLKKGLIVMFDVRTDLAVEARELYSQRYKKEIDGVVAEETTQEDVKITKVTVLNENGAEAMGKPVGTYITIDMPEYTHYDGELMDKVAHILSESISEVMKVEKDGTVLVVGLGNSEVTPDALGPKVVSKLMITRHLKAMMPDSIDEDVKPVCAIAPGVLGTTGIETGEIVRALVSKIKPDAVICIDALASRRLERVNRTIQLGNTGISPGAGVGNKRMEINEGSLGVPVIAIGVPTVVDAATIANDTIDLVIDEMIKQSTPDGAFFNMLKSMDRKEKQYMIREILTPYVGDLMVTPKDVDAIIDAVSKVISTGINLALQPGFGIEDINKFLN